MAGDGSDARWERPQEPTHGPGLDGRTGDGGRIYQAARDINRSRITHVLVSGWAVLGAVVAVAAGAGGAYVLTTGHGKKEPGGEAPPAAVSSPAHGPTVDHASAPPGATAGAGTPSGTDPATASPDHRARKAPSGSTVRWQGTLAVGPGDGKELDGDHPVTGSSPALGGFDISTGELGDGIRAFAGNGAIARWQDPTREPGESDCADTVDARGEPYGVKLREGVVLCLRTDEGHVVRLKVTRAPQDYMSAVEFETVVWNTTDGQGG
nr:hypothetical protein StreXyl84_14710 [Streptomyces sp. Xyl84]